MTTLSARAEIIEVNRTHPQDTGSSAVQIALLTDRIVGLTEHLKTHSKDSHTRLGLIKLVGRRNRLLRYLQRTDTPAYEALLSRLGIRGVKTGS